MSVSDTIILDKIYPNIKTLIAKNHNKFKACTGRYFQTRSKALYDTCPCDRIYFGVDDLADFYKSTGIDPKEVSANLRQTYYFSIPNFNPEAARDEFTISVMNIIRYYKTTKDTKSAQLAAIYLSFSGKFYPSIHYGRFPSFAPSEHRHVMEYVINNDLSNKFAIKQEGSLFGAIRSTVDTWLNNKDYEDRFKKWSDEDIAYLIQQLHNRIKSFLTNIAEVYYKAYENNEYMSYDTDRLVDGEEDQMVAISDNDSTKAEKAIEKAMVFLNNNTVDMKLCKAAADSNVKVNEIYGIIDSILSDNNNIKEIREFVSGLVYDYMANSTVKDIKNINFINYSITPKSNTRNPIILRRTEILEKWLDKGSPNYRRRKSRLATKSSYHRSVILYFTLVIYNCNK